ncbi:MAG: efflux RND transporter periplasmic adaptor subunit [Planctomycetes bacterium]|nr:efflux RND transporter periplasmic adaptor subunit [Planctomycetota bacterium]
MPPSIHRSPRHRAGGRALVWAALSTVVVLVSLAVAGVLPGPWRGEAGPAAVEGAPVRRGPLRIAVTASGALQAAENVSLTSGVEGRTTVLALVPEGSQVKKGDVVCELDATPMVEKRVQQNISLGSAEAALVKASQTFEIQESQNRSDVKKARQAITFAEQDLKMFLEGERASELEKARQTIDLAREEAKRAGSNLAWSEKLAEKGFLTATELDADRIAEQRARVELEQAERDADLLERFRLPRREAELRNAVEESQQECERVELQAKARIVDFESNLKACQAIRDLEKEKLERLETQIEKARIRAPSDGFVVYAQRDWDESPIREGTEVREREEIMSIPSTDGMVAEVKLHESVLKQVQLGLPCVVKIDALTGAELQGRVSFVAMLPDQTSRWMNPNVRLYRAQIAITTPHPGMRPGMSCSGEILIEELPDTLYVPVQAVFRDKQGTFCFVRQNGEVQRRDVTVGRFNELWVQLLSGVEEGEIALLSAPVGFDAATLAPESDETEKPATPEPQ